MARLNTVRVTTMTSLLIEKLIEFWKKLRITGLQAISVVLLGMYSHSSRHRDDIAKG